MHAENCVMKTQQVPAMISHIAGNLKLTQINSNQT